MFTYNTPVGDNAEQDATSKEERNVHQSVCENERQRRVQPVCSFFAIESPLFQDYQVVRFVRKQSRRHNYWMQILTRNSHAGIPATDMNERKATCDEQTISTLARMYLLTR